MNQLPRARSEGVICERVDDELVVYDEQAHTAHSLSAAAAMVWERCDGKTAVDEIASKLGLKAELVERAVEELRGSRLLDEVPTGYSRREAAKRIAQVGGAALAAPLIYSVAVPTAAAAASTCPAGQTLCNGSCLTCSGNGKTCGGGSCNGGGNCCSGVCCNNICCGFGALCVGSCTAVLP